MKEVNEIHEEAQKAIGSLAGMFGFAQKMKEELEQIEQDTPTKAIKDAQAMLKFFKWLARGEWKYNHSSKEVQKLLEEIGKILPRELKDKEEEFKNRLEDANEILVTLGSFYTGIIKKEISDLEKDEKFLLRLEEDPENKGIIEFKNRLESDFKILEEKVNKLNEWIGTNTTLVKQIDQWAQQLAVKAAA